MDEETIPIEEKEDIDKVRLEEMDKDDDETKDIVDELTLIEEERLTGGINEELEKRDELDETTTEGQSRFKVISPAEGP
jgi:hypothetical protein